MGCRQPISDRVERARVEPAARWSGWEGSNLRPHAPKARALPLRHNPMEPSAGLEPATVEVEARRSVPAELRGHGACEWSRKHWAPRISRYGIRWWTVSVSNRPPPACKAGALPDELTARRDGGTGEDSNLTAGLPQRVMSPFSQPRLVHARVPTTGFEPVTFRLWAGCSAYRARLGRWGDRRDLNSSFEGHILACLSTDTTASVHVRGIEPRASSV